MDLFILFLRYALHSVPTWLIAITMLVFYSGLKFIHFFSCSPLVKHYRVVRKHDGGFIIDVEPKVSINTQLKPNSGFSCTCVPQRKEQLSNLSGIFYSLYRFCLFFYCFMTSSVCGLHPHGSDKQCNTHTLLPLIELFFSWFYWR